MVGTTKTPVKRTAQSSVSPSSRGQPKPKKSRLRTPKSNKTFADELLALQISEGDPKMFDEKIEKCLKNDQMNSAIFWADKRLAFATKHYDMNNGRPMFKDIAQFVRTLSAAQCWMRISDYLTSQDCIFSHLSLTYYYVNSLWHQNMHNEIVLLPLALVGKWEGVPEVSFEPHVTKYKKESYYPTSDDKNALDKMVEEYDLEAALLLLLGKVYTKVVNREAAKACFLNCLKLDICCYEAWDFVLKYHLLKREEINKLLSDIPDNCSDITEVMRIYVESYQNQPPVRPINDFEFGIIDENDWYAMRLFGPQTEKKWLQLNGPRPGNPREGQMKYTKPKKSEKKDIVSIIENPALKERLSKNQKALKIHDKLVDDVDMITIKAMKYYNAGENQRCLEITQELYNKYGFNSFFFLLHLAVLTEMKKSEQLFVISHELVDKCSEGEVAWYAVGCYYISIEQYFAAKQYFNKAILMNPNFSEGWMAMGHANSLGGEHEQALNCYFRCHRLLEGSWEPLMYIAVQHMKTHNLCLSQNFLKDAMRLSPGNIMILIEDGAMHYSKDLFEDLERAMYIWTQALHIVMGNPNGPSKLEFNYLKGYLDSPISPRWEVLLNNLGQVCRRLCRYRESIVFHRKAISMECRDVSNLVSMALSYAGLRKFEKALDLLHEAATITPNGTTQSSIAVSCIEAIVPYYLYDTGVDKDLKIQF
uniref:Cdc23 domain-containing protein n=1 Tax=Strongyloides stercoralis TaxID=6248 RepID=A0A913HDK6_STRER